MYSIAQRPTSFITAYYRVSEKTVLSSFRRCGLLEGDPRKVVESQVNEGSRATTERMEELAKYAAAYKAVAGAHRRTGSQPEKAATPDSLHY